AGQTQGEGQVLSGVHYGISDGGAAQGDGGQPGPAESGPSQAGVAGGTHQFAAVVSVQDAAQCYLNGAAQYRPVHGRVYICGDFITGTSLYASAYQPSGDAGAADGQRQIPDQPDFADDPPGAEKPGDGAGLPAGRCAALFGDLYQSGG